MNATQISGSIGIKVLYNSNLDKKIFIFYDDHSNIKYCKNTNQNQTFISDFFNKIHNEDIALILEEPFMDPDSKIKILWDNSRHLFLFRKFYTKLMSKCSNKKICKIFPFDIRLTIFDISPDEIIFNLNEPISEYKIKSCDYFQNIFFLFELNDYEPNKKSMIYFIKKVFDVYKKSSFYKSLKKRVIDFNKKYDLMSNNKTIYDLIKENNVNSNFIYEEGYPFINNHNDNFIDQLDKIASAIMEFYSLILIMLLPNKNMVIYAGYYHSNNLAYILNKHYDFIVEYKNGITDDIESVNSSKINNCINIDFDDTQFIK